MICAIMTATKVN